MVTGFGPRRVKIASLATYVPPRLLTNADLERLVETTDEWILQRTGIRQRHVVDPGVATSDLAAAAREAITRPPAPTQSSDHRRHHHPRPHFPSTACLGRQIGATKAWGCD